MSKKRPRCVPTKHLSERRMRVVRALVREGRDVEVKRIEFRNPERSRRLVILNEVAPSVILNEAAGGVKDLRYDNVHEMCPQILR